jgi:hypothetical protein
MTKYRTSKFTNFVNYCNKNLSGKKLREIKKFSSEEDISDKFYNLEQPHGSHGHWMIHIDVIYFQYNKNIYQLGFQYQDETCKINCSRPGKYYNTSTPDEIKEFIGLFKNNAPNDYRVNPPKTRAYVSMSKKYKTIGSLSDKEFAKELYLKFLDALKIIKILKKAFIEFGCQFYY